MFKETGFGRWSDKTGPNDARCVVWAKGVFFFSFFHVFTT